MGLLLSVSVGEEPGEYVAVSLMDFYKCFYVLPLLPKLLPCH